MDAKMNKKKESRRSKVGWALRTQSKPQIDIISTLSSLFWRDAARVGAVFRAHKEPDSS